MSQAVYKRLAVRQVATSSYHPNENGGVDTGACQLWAQVLAMVVNEWQDDWDVHFPRMDVHFPHMEFAYNNSVSTATGLTLSEVHINRLPRLPMTVIEHRYARGYRSLPRAHFEYHDLAADCQRRAYELIREQHKLPVSRIERRHSALSEALHKLPTYTLNDRVWVYHSDSSIRQEGV